MLSGWQVFLSMCCIILFGHSHCHIPDMHKKKYESRPRRAIELRDETFQMNKLKEKILSRKNALKSVGYSFGKSVLAEKFESDRVLNVRQQPATIHDVNPTRVPFATLSRTGDRIDTTPRPPPTTASGPIRTTHHRTAPHSSPSSHIVHRSAAPGSNSGTSTLRRPTMKPGTPFKPTPMRHDSRNPASPSIHRPVFNGASSVTPNSGRRPMNPTADPLRTSFASNARQPKPTSLASRTSSAQPSRTPTHSQSQPKSTKANRPSQPSRNPERASSLRPILRTPQGTPPPKTTMNRRPMTTSAIRYRTLADPTLLGRTENPTRSNPTVRSTTDLMQVTITENYDFLMRFRRKSTTSKPSPSIGSRGSSPKQTSPRSKPLEPTAPASTTRKVSSSQKTTVPSPEPVQPTSMAQPTVPPVVTNVSLTSTSTPFEATSSYASVEGNKTTTPTPLTSEPETNRTTAGKLIPKTAPTSISSTEIPSTTGVTSKYESSTYATTSKGINMTHDNVPASTSTPVASSTSISATSPQTSLQTATPVLRDTPPVKVQTQTNPPSIPSIVVPAWNGAARISGNNINYVYQGNSKTIPDTSTQLSPPVGSIPILVGSATATQPCMYNLPRPAACMLFPQLCPPLCPDANDSSSSTPTTTTVQTTHSSTTLIASTHATISTPTPTTKPLLDEVIASIT